jgi:hypothetical protein
MQKHSNVSIVTDEDIREFIELWQREFAEVLTPDAARERADELVDLFWRLALHRPADIPRIADDSSPPSE